MSDSIYGDRFLAARGGPAWHSKGTVMDDPAMTALDGIKKAHIDYEYVSVPVGYQLPSGQFVQDDERVAILRGPSGNDTEWVRLGIVSDNYTYLQNHELAAGVDAVRQATGWRLETVGALGQGEVVFMSLYSGKRSIKGDEIDTYFLVSDGKAAKRSLSISSTIVRVVCKNTLAAADGKSSVGVKLGHRGSVATDFSDWIALVPKLAEIEEGQYLDLERMASARISDAQAKRIIAAAYPEPKKSSKAHVVDVLSDPSVVDMAVYGRLQSAKSAHESELDRILTMREAVFENYVRFNDGAEVGGRMEPAVLAAVAGTPYAALQAITEVVDWGDSLRGPSSDVAGIFGAKRAIKERAWDAALRMS
jgi:hypothetical protein